MDRITAIYRALFALFTAIATYYFFVPIENVGPGIPHFDKVAHFIVFFVLAHFFSFAASENIKIIVIIALIYGASIELIQGLLPYRSASLPDLVADMLGAIFYTLIHPKVRLIFKAKSK